MLWGQCLTVFFDQSIIFWQTPVCSSVSQDYGWRTDLIQHSGAFTCRRDPRKGFDASVWAVCSCHRNEWEIIETGCSILCLQSQKSTFFCEVTQTISRAIIGLWWKLSHRLQCDSRLSQNDLMKLIFHKIYCIVEFMLGSFRLHLGSDNNCLSLSYRISAPSPHRWHTERLSWYRL